jgi:hypothetical protein
MSDEALGRNAGAEKSDIRSAAPKRESVRCMRAAEGERATTIARNSQAPGPLGVAPLESVRLVRTTEGDNLSGLGQGRADIVAALPFVLALRSEPK